MFNSIFYCVLIINYVFGITGKELELIDTSPEEFPHHAFVDSKWACNGILLSKDFVLTPANCVDGSETATVYLGCSISPWYTIDNNVQTRSSSKIFIHEDFTNLGVDHYLNNIAIIKLASPAILTNKVKPAKLISRQEAHLIGERFVNMTGWISSDHTSLKLTTGKLLNEDTCGYVFGSQLLNQELCFRWDTKDNLDVVGNSAQLNDKVIGFLTNSSPYFEGYNMIMSFIPFLNWIAQTTEISEEEFTVQEYNCEKDLSKLANNANEDKLKLEEEIKAVVKVINDALAKIMDIFHEGPLAY